MQTPSGIPGFYRRVIVDSCLSHHAYDKKIYTVLHPTTWKVQLQGQTITDDPGDDTIIRIANNLEAVIFTRDCGYIDHIFKKGFKHKGIIIVKGFEKPEETRDICLQTLKDYKDAINKCAIVVARKRNKEPEDKIVSIRIITREEQRINYWEYLKNCEKVKWYKNKALESAGIQRAPLP